MDRFLNYSRSVNMTQDSENLSNQIEKELDNLKIFFGESFEDCRLLFLSSMIDNALVHALRTKTGLDLYSFENCIDNIVLLHVFIPEWWGIPYTSQYTEAPKTSKR